MYEILKDWTSDEATNALPFLDRTFIYVFFEPKAIQGVCTSFLCQVAKRRSWSEFGN